MYMFAPKLTYFRRSLIFEAEFSEVDVPASDFFKFSATVCRRNIIKAGFTICALVFAFVLFRFEIYVEPNIFVVDLFPQTHDFEPIHQEESVGI